MQKSDANPTPRTTLDLSAALSRRQGPALAHRHSHSVPSVKVTIVSGPPTLKYAQGLIATPRAAAFSTTIKLATDPSTMKFPASVDAIAMTSQAVR